MNTSFRTTDDRRSQEQSVAIEAGQVDEEQFAAVQLADGNKIRQREGLWAGVNIRRRISHVRAWDDGKARLYSLARVRGAGLEEQHAGSLGLEGPNKPRRPACLHEEETGICVTISGYVPELPSCRWYRPE